MRSPIRQVLPVTLLSASLLIALAPILWGAFVALRRPVDAFALPSLSSLSLTGAFFRAVWLDGALAFNLLNSLLVATFTLAISLPIGCMAGYGLARLSRRTEGAVMALLLALRSLPPILLAIPYYMVARGLDLIDTYTGLLLATVALNQPFVVWLMRGFFRDLPPELEEAALIDGATEVQAFRHVLLPAVRPGLAVAALFSLLLTYNEFTYALVLTGRHTRTLPVALATLAGDDIVYWSLAAAAALGAMVPPILAVLLLQRHLLPRLRRTTVVRLQVAE